MRVPPVLPAALLLVLGSACSPMPRVALDASPGDLEMLSGEWAGEYSSAALARQGRIEFTLRAGTDDARGDVVMYPAGGTQPYQRHSGESQFGVPGGVRPEVLTIRFVRASSGMVAGMLDRYWDPDRNCYADTVFRGHIGLGVVEGTFTTTFDCGDGEATGRWRIEKRKSARRQS